MSKNKESSIKHFVEDVNFFLNSQDSILKWMDEIYYAYMQGYDIREKIINLENVYPGFYRLFLSIFYFDKNSDFISKSELSSENLDKIFELKTRYIGLKDILHRIKREEEGRINSWTTIDRNFSFDLDRNTPQIEITVVSGDKQIFYTKDNIEDIYSLSENIVDSIFSSLEMCQNKNIAIDSESIKAIKSINLEIDKKVKKISEIIEKKNKLKRKQETKKMNKV